MASLTDTVIIDKISSAVVVKMGEHWCKQEGRIAIVETKALIQATDIGEMKSAVRDVARAMSSLVLEVKDVKGTIEVQKLKMEKKLIVAFGTLSIIGGAGGSAAYKAIAQLFGG
jgi:hypothetical protein